MQYEDTVPGLYIPSSQRFSCFFFFFNLLLNCSIFQSAVDATSITPPIREFMDNANGDHQRAEDESLG